jgi:predicted O-methyltransferase YrrM
VAAPASAPGVVADAPAQAPRQQVEQVRQAVDTLMQAPRAMPDDTK